MGNINVSLVFTVTVFNQYLISHSMFYEASSGVVCNLYSRKSYSPSQGALYFILLLFFKGVVGFREACECSSCLGSNNRTKHAGICGCDFFMMMFGIGMCRISQNHFFRTLSPFFVVVVFFLSKAAR